MPIKQIDTLDYLSHHGIIGQRWGVRHGPPYPLNKATSARIKKNAETNGDNEKSSNSGKKKFDIDKKTAIMLVGVGLVTAGLIYMSVKSDKEDPFSDIVPEGLKNANAKFLESTRSREKIDPKTGLYLKNKAMTMAEDMECVNPSWKLDDGFKNNCTFCTATMEMRRRGYDVAAGATRVGFDSETTERWFKGAKTETFRLKVSSSDRDKDSVRIQSVDEIINKAKAQKEGARGDFGVVDACGFGHSMFYTIENGKMVVYDSQNTTLGGRISEEGIRKLCSKSKWVTLCRLDNCEPDIELMQKTGVFV